MPILRIISICLGLLAIAAPSATAASFNATPDNVQAQIDAATNAGNPGDSNTVILGAGSYTAATLTVGAITGGRQLAIVGAGQGATIIGALQAVSGRLALGYLTAQGAVTGGSSELVVTFADTGNVSTSGPMTLDHVVAPAGASIVSSGGLVITDSTFAGTSTSALLTLAGGGASIRRSTVVNGGAGPAISVNPQTSASLPVNIDNSVLRGSITIAHPAGGPVPITLKQVTQLSTGVSISATGPNASGTAITMTNSILGSLPDTVNAQFTLQCSFSGLPATLSGGCAPGTGGNTSNPANVNDLFVDAPNGNVHLAPNSAAIDHGSSTALDSANESTTDLDGNPRIVGYADCLTATRDQGAYETPSVAAHPAVTVSGPTSATVGDNSTFTMVGSGVASVKEADWRFGDGGTGLGTTIQHAWTTAGTIGVELRAIGTNGCVTQLDSTVAVAATKPPPPPPDHTAPRVTNVKLSPKSFKSGKKPKLTLKLSELATVTATIMRRDPGVFKGSKCVKRKKGQKGAGCLRDHPLSHAAFVIPTGKFTLTLTVGKLKVGKYVIQLTSKDAAGNAGKVVRVGFTVKK